MSKSAADYGWVEVTVMNAWGDSEPFWREVALPFDAKAKKRLQEDINDEEDQRDHYRGCILKLGTPSADYLLKRADSARSSANHLLLKAETYEAQARALTPSTVEMASS